MIDELCNQIYDIFCLSDCLFIIFQDNYHLHNARTVQLFENNVGVQDCFFG